jgi:dimethylhistidine N-methyltransferase
MCPRKSTQDDHMSKETIDLKHQPLVTLDTPIKPNDNPANGIDEEINADIAELEAGLRSASPPNLKRVPVKYLYDTLGSDLYEQITELEEYYPYMEEKNLLDAHAEDIISHLPKGAVVVELGCGDGSKTSILLNAIARRDGPSSVHFVGIDVSGGALIQAERNLQNFCPEIPTANLEFIEAEYFSGLTEAHKRHPDKCMCMLWLGSSVGNFTFPEAADFLAKLKIAAGEDSVLLLCTDLWKNPAVLHLAYDDPKGVTEKFILNGMAHALRSLNHPAAEHAMQSFKYDCVVNEDLRQVEMWVIAKESVENVLPGVNFCAGERILMEISRKFTPQDITGLAKDAGMCVQATWASTRYSIQLLLSPKEAFQRCWNDTDALFSHISDWQAQPIGLRHPFGFYYGHVAAFSHLKLNPQQPPSALDTMLSRGIDPLVLDPSKCHSHPEVPQTWPTQEELATYVAEARASTLNAAKNSAGGDTADEMHAVLMSLEHERMHQETLCYMLAQQRKQDWLTNKEQPQPRIETTDAPRLPPFYFNARASYLTSSTTSSSNTNNTNTSSTMVTVPGSTAISLGINPCTEKHGFVWDNELGTSGPFTVKALSVAVNPVTVAEFYDFVVNKSGYSLRELWDKEDFDHFKKNGHEMPATWSRSNPTNTTNTNTNHTPKEEEEDIYVHMPEGTFHWTAVADCPVYCSLGEALAFCKLKKCRIMTEPEYQNILLHNNNIIDSKISEKINKFDDGGWEWTSSEFAPFDDGFAADPLYPEYSVDFFDGCHYVLKGSCPYTHPSAKRASFRNYYQRQYRNMFAKFRIVKEEEEE